MKFSPSTCSASKQPVNRMGSAWWPPSPDSPPAFPISLDAVNRELWRRQQGYGRGGRMKIETDRAEIVAGVRHSHTIGAPIAILIQNKDWKNWTEALPVEDADGAEESTSRSRGRVPAMPTWPAAIKYNFHDARYILERASARETTARVAVGALAKSVSRRNLALRF